MVQSTVGMLMAKMLTTASSNRPMFCQTRNNAVLFHLLQSTVGTLVAKTLTTASSNPYAANPTTRSGAPAALDAFSIQVGVKMHFSTF